MAAVRVVLDGSSLSFPPSGIRTYVSALIQEFAGLDQAVNLRVVEPSCRVARSMPKRASRFWWDAWGVSTAALREQVRVLHLPQFSAPVRRPAPVVVTIHDLIPLTWPEYRQRRSMRIYLEVMQRTVRNAES